MSEGAGMRVTLLGTGCPAPSLARNAPSQIVWAGAQPLLVDCGAGVTSQLLRARVDLTAVMNLFITHHHLDHVGGFLDFLIASWTVGRKSLQIFGPRGTARMTEALLGDVFKEDINYRLSIHQPPEGIRNIKVIEFDEGLAHAENGWKVAAARVNHSHNMECIGFRFEFGGRTVVVSGDTTYCRSIVDLARDAEILVQECTISSPAPPPVPWITSEMWNILKTEHSAPEQAGRIAREAGVKKLVLSHLVPSVERERTLAKCAQEFSGETYLGEDLMEIHA